MGNCPVCGVPGFEPVKRWVKNKIGKKYEPCHYFGQRIKEKINGKLNGVT